MQTKIQQVQETVYAATAGSAVATGFIAEANEWLQFISLIVAIIAGGLAIRSHFKKGKSKK